MTYPPNATAASLVREAAARVPDRAALVAADGRQVTYAELATSGDRLGNALLTLGLAPGDRVAAWMEDSPEYMQLYVACAFAGLVVVPINALPPHDGNDRLGSIGCAVAGVDVRVVDQDGNDVPAEGESVGELIFRSPALMAGYWRNPDASSAAIRDGWYHSGDLGSMDADGYLWLHERRSDLIVSGGMNVYTLEVEEVIARVPGVQTCAVVGLPDERWGQAVAAAVVVEPGKTVTEEQVLEACRTYLASFKKPTRVAFVSELPMTASMKISRSRVRDSLLQNGS